MKSMEIFINMVEIQVTEAVDSSASPQSNDKLIIDDIELVVEVSKIIHI